ncbi:MAG TPA: peptidyl-prolyl cis-trans isomerase [Candidatus Polarisedimenticolia bacterium]|jgi:parvulin-like peptidyl-prolyl isomerase|nr:peptidyl-prolyl cis-trans isomerase [Candidatus Polarisedimenticolia bacterium]
MRRWLRAAALAGFVLIPPGSIGAAILEEIVAKVNNSIITRTEYEERLAVFRQQMSEKYTGDELDRKIASGQEALLHNMIIENLLVQRADVLLDMDKVRKNLVEDFKKNQKIESDEELERLLKEQSMTRQQLVETLVRLNIPQEIINYEVRRKISISDKEIQQYYDSHKAEFTRPERISLREIVILYEDATRQEAKARAEGVRRELDAGADFEALVKRESQAASKERGGLVGPFARGELRSDLEKEAFRLQPGQIAGPIESARAYQIVKLESREPEEVTPLDKARDGIADHLRDAKFQEKVDAYLKKQWSDNFIYVYPKFGTSEWLPVTAGNPPESDSKPEPK